jgi:hypothetical protein
MWDSPKPTRADHRHVFKPVAKFLSKMLFEPDMKHVNLLIRYTFTPVGFWLNTYKLDYIVGVARKA